MQLTVQDLSKLISVPEKTIHHWIQEGEIPVHRVRSQYRFNRAEVLEWAISKGVKIAGSPWELVVLSFIFIVGSLGMGVLISNISQSQMQAIYLALFLVLIPAIILSGLMFSRENMPAFTYWYSELLPVTQYLEICRGIMLRGISAGTLWLSSTLPMLILSVIYFVASVLVFRKRI